MKKETTKATKGIIKTCEHERLTPGTYLRAECIDCGLEGRLSSIGGVKCVGGNPALKG